MAFWNTEEVNFLQNNLGLTTKELYTLFVLEFGTERTYDSVQKQIKKLRAQFQDDDAPNENLVENNNDLADAFQALADILNDLDEEENETPPELPVNNITPSTTAQSNTVISSYWPGGYTPLQINPPVGQINQTSPTPSILKQEVSNWIKELNGVVGKSYIRPKTINSDKPSLVVLLSDNHFGKITSTFNMEVAKERIEELPKTLFDLGVDPNIDEIVVIFAGDQVEGEDIFPTQNASVEAPAITQIKYATKAYWQMLKNFLATFPGVTIRTENCPGNHGRTSKTANVTTNWDNVIYQTLMLLAEQEGNPRLQMVPNLDWINVFDVKGKKGMAYHYGVKHTGTPAMQMKVSNWILMKGIDFMVKGHHHKWEIGTQLGRPVISNGSLCGPDDYSDQMAVEEPPRQAYFYVSKDRPISTFSFVEWK